MAKKKNKSKSNMNVSPPAERVDAELVEDDFELQPREEADENDLLFDNDALEEQGAYLERAGAPHNSVIQTNPSEFPNPYVSEEEQGMDMRPAVVGPPAYGSPDPLTSAGRLLPLEQHPLRAEVLPEGHPAAISGDYGEGYDHTLREPSDLARHSVGDFTKESNEEVNATDGARELADENNVDLSEVTGSGEDGRITKADVEDFLAEQESA